MQETKYNGPEMNAKKIIVLLVTAALILTLFLARTCKQDPADMPADEELQQKSQDYIYISPFDSLFRLYADSVCDWEMLAAIAYVESKFDTTARSYRRNRESKGEM